MKEKEIEKRMKNGTLCCKHISFVNRWNTRRSILVVSIKFTCPTFTFADVVFWISLPLMELSISINISEFVDSCWQENWFCEELARRVWNGYYNSRVNLPKAFTARAALVSATASLKETKSSLFLFKVNDVISVNTSCKRLREVRSKRR